MITKVTLTFRPLGLGLPVIATATDPDGEGVQDLIVDGPIELTPGTSYSLTIELFNELADPNDPAYNITQEVLEEADEHMFFSPGPTTSSVSLLETAISITGAMPWPMKMKTRTACRWAWSLPGLR
jgi:hypothetical protein